MKNTFMILHVYSLQISVYGFDKYDSETKHYIKPFTINDYYRIGKELCLALLMYYNIYPSFFVSSNINEPCILNHLDLFK